jgi:hypothetical protein
MSQTEERVTAFEPEVVTWRIHPVDELLELSKKNHWGFYYIGPSVDEAEGFDWYPMRIFPKSIHKEALRRLEIVRQELPHIEIVQVLIGDEIDENPGPSWEKRAQAVEDKVLAGGKQAAPIVAKAVVAATAVGAACVLGVAAIAAVTASAVVAAPAVGLLALDPQMVLIVSDGQSTHAVNICSWLD